MVRMIQLRTVALRVIPLADICISIEFEGIYEKEEVMRGKKFIRGKRVMRGKN